jgi:hypothetical protein
VARKACVSFAVATLILASTRLLATESGASSEAPSASSSEPLFSKVVVLDPSHPSLRVDGLTIGLSNADAPRLELRVDCYSAESTPPLRLDRLRYPAGAQLINLKDQDSKCASFQVAATDTVPANGNVSNPIAISANYVLLSKYTVTANSLYDDPQDHDSPTNPSRTASKTLARTPTFASRQVMFSISPTTYIPTYENGHFPKRSLQNSAWLYAALVSSPS